MIEFKSSAKIPTQWGDFVVSIFSWSNDGKEHIALVQGNETKDVLVRVHSECMTGDVFGSLKCDCGPQLHSAFEMIQKQGAGVVVYLRQEGRGIGLVDKLRAYVLQEQGFDTVDANLHLGLPADARDFRIAVEVIRKLGIESVRLITNNPHKTEAFEGSGIVVSERVSCLIETDHSAGKRYLQTKRDRLGHFFPKS